MKAGNLLWRSSGIFLTVLNLARPSDDLQMEVLSANTCLSLTQIVCNICRSFFFLWLCLSSQILHTLWAHLVGLQPERRPCLCERFGFLHWTRDPATIKIRLSLSSTRAHQKELLTQGQPKSCCFLNECTGLVALTRVAVCRNTGFCSFWVCHEQLNSIYDQCWELRN